ncbi:MAG TPA: hypothetical protein VKX16_10400 [Chloroflexota bacterium]|nr:hypothetical protein [Chloroflexota bacterium]
MPLDARKLAHIVLATSRSFDARAQPVTFYLRQRDGSTSQLVLNVIWRVLGDFDPTLEAPTQSTTRLGTSDDILCAIKTTDITLQQLRACVYAAPGPQAPGAQPASRYILTNIEVAGMPPGGDRYYVSFAQQH